MPDKIRARPSPPYRTQRILWLFEIIAVVGAVCLSALILNQGVTFKNPWVSAAAIEVFVVILPGYLLTSVLFPNDEFDFFTKVALSGGLGIGLFLVLSTLLLFVHSELFAVSSMLLIVEIVLFILFILTRTRSRRSCSRFATGISSLDRVTISYFSLFFFSIAFLIFFWSKKAPVWRYGDAWFYVPVMRSFLQSPNLEVVDVYIGKNLMGARQLFGGWWVFQAYLSGLGNIAPVDMLLVYIRPLLMIVSLLGVYGLTKELSRNTRTALLVVVVQIVFYVSDIAGSDALGRGAIGYQFFGRLGEDKATVAFVLVPIAILLAIRFLTDGRFGTLLGFFLLAAGISVIHPQGMVYLGLSCTLFLIVRFFFCRDKAYISRSILILLIIGLCFSVPIGQLFIRHGNLVSETASLETVLNETTSRVQSNKLLILSEAYDLYMLNPELLENPYLILSILLSLVMLFRIKRDIAAQFIFSNLALLLFFLYNPVTASVLGRIMTPVLLWRMLWILPIGLAIGYAFSIVIPYFERVLQRILESVRSLVSKTHRVTGRVPAASNSMAGILVPWLLVGGLFFIQFGRVLAGGQVLDTMKSASVTAEERGFLEKADSFIEPRSYVIANPSINELVPAFTDGYVLYFKGNEPFSPEAEQDIKSVFDLDQVDEEFVEILVKYPVAQYLIASQESDSSLISKLDQMPLVLAKVFQDDGFVLYAFNLDRSTQAGRAIVWGSYYYLIGDDEQALQSFLQVTSNGMELSESDLALAYVGMGNVRLRLGLLEAAIEAYREALYLVPDLGQAHIGLGNAYWRMGELEKAVESFGQVLESDPHAAIVRARQFHVLGDWYQKDGKLQQAVESYTASARLHNSLNNSIPEEISNMCDPVYPLGQESLATGNPVSVGIFVVEGLQRVVLYQHPSSQVAYRLQVPPSSKLVFDIGLSQAVWKLGNGDGVGFDIRIDDGDLQWNVFSKYIDPKNLPADRRWHTHEIDLSIWAGQTVTITFATDPGPNGDLRYDWAAWGYPCIVQP